MCINMAKLRCWRIRFGQHVRLKTIKAPFRTARNGALDFNHEMRVDQKRTLMAAGVPSAAVALISRMPGAAMSRRSSDAGALSAV